MASPSESSAVLSQTGQEDEKKPLRFLVDLEFGILPDSTQIKTGISDFLKTIKKLGGPQEMKLETLPADPEKRRIALQNLRVELMSGGGPDVFLCSSGSAMNGGEETQAVFNFPERAMEQGQFLPLDSYIETAQFMKWDELTETVMAAGRTEEGQMILPLVYTFPVTYWKGSQTEPSQTMTFDDMQKGSEAMQLSAAWPAGADAEGIAAVWGNPADLANDKLAFSEEELTQMIRAQLELKDRFSLTLESPEYYKNSMSVGFDVLGEFSPFRFFHGISEDEEISMIPLYSKDGGYCAVITSFAAVNRNTENPAEAFFLLDYLLSKKCQQSQLYCPLAARIGLPTDRELMSKSRPVFQHTTTQSGARPDWYMNDKTFENFTALRDSLTGARFRNQLDYLMGEMYREVYYSDTGSVEEIVHRYYSSMSQLLGES